MASFLIKTGIEMPRCGRFGPQQCYDTLQSNVDSKSGLAAIAARNVPGILDRDGRNETMPLTSEETAQIVKEFGRSEGDTGCPEVQIALLTARIKQVATHLRENKQDMHNRRGLVMMVGKRNRLLRYLARTNRDAYLDTIKRLGLRK